MIFLSPVLYGKAHDAVGIGDVELVADQRHSERLTQIFQEHAVLVGDAVTIRVAQDRNSVGVLRDRTRAAHHHVLRDCARAP